MSSENVEIARRAYEAFNAGDISGWLTLYSPDAELHDLPVLPGAAVYRAPPELQTWAEQMIETAEDLRFEPQRVIDAGQFVLVHVRGTGKGRGSGAPGEISFFHVAEFGDGKIRRLRGYSL